MGFFSNAVFYRPDTPPIVTPNELSAFLEKLLNTGFAKHSKLSTADINWGDQISEDIRPFDLEEDNEGGWSTIKSIDPDFSYDGDFRGLISELKTRKQTIGRLFISGNFNKEQYEWFQSPHPSGEEINFRPDSWSLEFGEVRLGTLSGWELDNGEEISDLQIGMMSFAISGYGYFYPWEFKDWVEKFTISPCLQEVCELCRSTWPVDSAPPSEELVMLRRECDGLWPYDDIHAPIGWAWGPSET